MKRKLVKQAGQAYTITLPINWVRERNLKAGDELELDVREKNILVSTDNLINTRQLPLSIKGFPMGSRFTYLSAAYALGIDEIDLEIDKGIYPNLSENLGYIIIDKKENKLKIKDVNHGSLEDVDLIFKRVFQVILSYFDEAVNDLSGKQIFEYDQIRNLDEEVNKLTFYLQRSVMKKNLESSINGKLFFAFSYALEKIGDEIIRMWRMMFKGKLKISKKVKELFNITTKLLNLMFSLYYRFSKIDFLKLNKLKVEFLETIDPLFADDSLNSIFLLHLYNIFDNVYDLKHLILMKEFDSR